MKKSSKIENDQRVLGHRREDPEEKGASSNSHSFGSMINNQSRLTPSYKWDDKKHEVVKSPGNPEQIIDHAKGRQMSLRARKMETARRDEPKSTSSSMGNCCAPSYYGDWE